MGEHVKVEVTEPQAIHGHEILIVDDEPFFRRSLGLELERHGYRVRTAASGEDAIEAIQQHQPDLILLDMRMPGIDGTEVCRLIKRSSRTSAIPVIMLTVVDGLDREGRRPAVRSQ